VYVPDRLADLDATLSATLAADVSDAERAILRLNAESPHVASLEALARLLLRAESVASSRIEGLEVGPRRLVRVEAARASGIPLTDQTAEAVLGNVEAMALAVGEVAAHPRLTTEDMLAIHQALMRHTHRPELGGQVRQGQNWIGGNNYNPCGAAFVPPPPGEVPELLDDLVAFLNSDRYSPLIQAALAHAQFETIHPFADGNGRTGRALIHVVLVRRGLAPRYVPPISLVLATRSRDYIGGLTATRYVGPPDSEAARSGIESWIGIFASAAIRASHDAEHFGEQIDTLVNTWRARAKPIRANSTVDRLLRALPSAPIVTVATAARLTGRSFQAANQAVEQLLQDQVLKQTSLGHRNRAFEATGLLDALTGFERGLASPEGDTRISPPVRPVPYRPAQRLSSNLLSD
jgi:Fic family protein